MKYLGNASLGVHHFVIAPDTSSSGASLERLVGQMVHQRLKEVTQDLCPYIDVFFLVKKVAFFFSAGRRKTDVYVLCV